MAASGGEDGLGTAGGGRRYEIVRELSHPEAPHLVCLSRDPGGVPCVLKRLRPEFGDREDLVLRLRLEAEILRDLRGEQGIVRLIALVDDPFTLVLEHVGGGSLADLLSGSAGDRAPLPVPRAVAIGIQLLHALAHAHERGVVHRDVKPSNVLFAGDGSLRLIDFGVAARADPARGNAFHALPAGWIEERVGTLPYAAPETVLDPTGPITPARDIFAAGVVLFEMLSGSPPWQRGEGESAESFARRVRHDAEGASALLEARVGPALGDVVAAAVDPDPSRRLASARQFAAALTLAEREPLAPPWTGDWRSA